MNNDIDLLLRTGKIIVTFVDAYQSQLQKLIDSVGWDKVDETLNTKPFVEGMQCLGDVEVSILQYLECIKQYLPHKLPNKENIV